MARINISQILMKRGNTTAANTYVGPLGELLVDTGLKTIRVQDGVTPGGMSTLATNVQLQALGTYANATFGTSSYGNANVALYLSTSSIISNINANITAANAAITSLQSNAAIQASLLDTLTGNAATQSTVLDTLTANAATQATTLSNLLGNAVAQQTSLTDLVANAATQAQAIAAATGTYSNANVKSYLASFDGNILPSANVTYSLGDATHQWRDLWVSNNTIYIGNTPIRVDGGTLLVNGAPVSGGAVSSLVNGASTFQLFANGQSRSPDTLFAGNGVSIINANGAIQGGIYNSGDADWFNIGASTGRGIKFYVDEETNGPLFFANGSVNVPGGLYSDFGVIGDVNMYGGTIYGTNPNWNYLTLINQGEGSVFVQLPSEATANVANLRIHNDIGNVEITTGDGFSYNYWYFGNDGDLTIPRDIFGTGTNPLVIQNTSTGSAYLELPIAPGTNPVYLSNQDPTGNVVIRTGDFGSENDWTFGMDGNLTIPGNIVYANGQSILSGIGGASLGNLYMLNSTTIANGMSSYLDFSSPVRLGHDLGNVQIIVTNQETSNTYEFTFANIDGSLNLPGNIISGGGQIQFIANSSGDGNGYATVRLIPDIDREFWDQYLIIDPTAPGHIHIRAGGTQDNSNADLILGGENSHVRVTAGSNPPVYIKANSASWTFGVDSGLSMPTGGNLYFDNSAVSVIDGITNINAIGTIGANVVQVLSDLTSFGASPAPRIYGFSSISTTGSAVNEGNISASGNLVASRNAYVTGNVFAARYNFANGVSILEGLGGGGGTYGNTQVAAYLPTYSGNAGAARVQVTNAVDFMYGGYPYMGWQLSGSDTLKLRTNIASGDYTHDAIIVDRQSLAVNVVARLTAGNITTTNGLYWANGSSILNNLASTNYVDTQITNLVNNAPALLDTLGEIAANLAIESNAIGSILNSISSTNANVTAANVGITNLQSNAAGQQTSIDTLLGQVNQAVNTTSSPQFAGLTTTANVELTANVHIHENLVVDGNINFIGNVTQTNITTANAVFTGDTYGFGALYAGVLGYTPLPYTVIQATADYNDYSQINFQNLNLSANASTEWVATAGNGSDLTNYIDFGIAGGAWNGTQLNSVGTAAKANDGWVYVLGNTTAGTGGNLVIGTIQSGRRVNILTGGPGSANIYSYFTSSGLTTANVSAANYLYANGVSILTGISGTYSNTNVAGYLAGTISTGNVNVGTAMRINGTTQTIDTANGSSIIIGSRINLTGSAAGYSMSVTHPAQFSSSLTVGTNSNAQSFYGTNYYYSNGVSILTGIGSTYSNTNVAAYLTSYTGNISANNITVSNTISAVSITTNGTSGNITGANVISANTFVFAANGVNILTAAGGSGTDDVLRANVGAYQTFANANVSSIQNQIFASNANIGAYQTFANANSATQQTSINTINANIGAYQIYANANSATQQTSIDSINANLGSFQTYANATFTGGGGGSTYSNTNVAAYLTTATVTTTGNVTATNLIATGNVYTSNIVTTGTTSGNISGANYISANAFQVTNGIFWANGTAWSSGSGTTYTSSGAGNITVSGSTLALTATGPAASAVGSSTAIPVITPDGYGRIASLSTAAVIAPAGTLSGTTLAATVVTSSLTSVGTLGSLTVTGNVTAGNASVTQVTATTGVYGGNVTAANIITTGTYGNITGANVISANTITVTTFVRTQAVTFASLPSASVAGAGARAFITDGNTATFAAAVSGSGANSVPVYSNGTNWFVG